MDILLEIMTVLLLLASMFSDFAFALPFTFDKAPGQRPTSESELIQAFISFLKVIAILTAILIIFCILYLCFRKWRCCRKDRFTIALTEEENADWEKKPNDEMEVSKDGVQFQVQILKFL